LKRESLRISVSGSVLMVAPLAPSKAERTIGKQQGTPSPRWTEGLRHRKFETAARAFALFRRHVLDDADEQREHHSADGAAGNIADPALDHLAGKCADELADDATADRAGDRVAKGAERILLGR